MNVLGDTVQGRRGGLVPACCNSNFLAARKKLGPMTTKVGQADAKWTLIGCIVRFCQGFPVVRTGLLDRWALNCLLVN